MIKINLMILKRSKFDPKHHNSVISEKQLNARKYKKELKSAIKEIRQDNQYLARVQLSEQLEKFVFCYFIHHYYENFYLI